jgi:hemolysin activation/secretion protein
MTQSFICNNASVLKRMIRFISVLMVASVLSRARPVSAQSTTQAPGYGSGSAVQQTVPPPVTGTTDPQKLQETPTVDTTAVPSAPLSLAVNETLFVKEVLLPTDNDEIHAALLRVVAPYLNHELTFTEINELTSRVTRYYRSHGYIVARAYLPRQDASDGILEIQVALGRYGIAKIRNKSRLRDSFVEGEFRHLAKSSPAVTASSLERTMLLLRETPGGAMPGVSLEPGTAPGTTDLDVREDREGQRYQGYLLGDNQGSRFTGEKRLFGSLIVNAPLGIGDRFSVDGLVSDGEKLHNLRVSYGAPLSYNGLRLTVAAARTRYALGGSFSALDATGSVSDVDGTFSYPLERKHDTTMDLSLNIAYRNLHDSLNAVSVFNPRTAEEGSATFRETKFSTIGSHHFYSTANATVTVGEMNLQNAAEIAATGTEGDYSKLVLNLSTDTVLFRSLSTHVSAVGQKDLRVKTLDSSEQLFISGSGGVRGYAEGVSGDNGFILNLEVSDALPRIRRWTLQQTLTAFADSGGVKAERNGSLQTNYMLNDAGVGYTAKQGLLYFKIQGVRLLGSIRSETSKTRLWLQLGFVF